MKYPVWERVRRMSNSTLVTYRHITKHKNSGRGKHRIQKIFVHHMAGNLTVKQCGNVFDTRQASAHYGVNGSAIGQYVDEADTAWHCGNFSWNQKSIGIELANDAGAKGNWHVADSTINTAIRLIADICRRNGIPKLVYTGDMNGNLCMHRWVCSTSCPGPYLATQFRRIEVGVNNILKAESGPIKLDVDGIGGPMTVTRMQEFLGTMQDGVISGQNKDMAKHYPALESVIFDDTESTCVKALQWMIGVYEDGVIGPDTVKAWQKFLGVENDGIFGPASMKAWQKYLNEHDKAVFPKTHAPKPEEPKKPASKPAASSSTADKIVKKAKSLAGKADAPTKAYKAALDKAYPNRKSWGEGARLGRSCDVFVAVVVKALGFDSNMPRGLRDQLTHKPNSKYFDRIVKTNVAPYDHTKAGDLIFYNGEHRHACIRTKTGIYEANHSSKKYPHVTKGFSKLKKKRSKVVIWRAK